MSWNLRMRLPGQFRQWSCQPANASSTFARRWQNARYLFRSGEQRNLLESGGLRIPQHHIHVLNRLAGSSLDQIVERGADDGTLGDAILGDPDEGHVGAAHVPGLRSEERRVGKEWRSGWGREQ